MQGLGFRGGEEQAGQLVGGGTHLGAGVDGRLDRLDEALRPGAGATHLGERRPQPGRPRHLPGEAQPAEGAERVDVGRRRRVGAEQHLGCDVARGAPDGGRSLAEHPAHPEVGQDGPALEVEEDVARGHVPVDHPRGVQPPEGAGQRGEDGDHLTGREVTPGPDQGREAPPAQQRHDQRQPPVGERDARLHREEVLGRDARGDRGLAQRRLGRLRVPTGDLDGDPAPLREQDALPHLADAAPAEQGPELDPGDLRGAGRLHPPTVPETGPTAAGFSTGPVVGWRG